MFEIEDVLTECLCTTVKKKQLSILDANLLKCDGQDQYRIIIGYINYFDDNFAQASKVFASLLDRNIAADRHLVALGLAMVILEQAKEKQESGDEREKLLDEAEEYLNLSLNTKPIGYAYNELSIVEYEKAKIAPDINSAHRLYDAAINYCKSGIEAENKEKMKVHPLNGLGNIYLKLGKFDEAESYFNRAVNSNPDYAYPYNGLGNVARERGHFCEAIKFYKIAIKKDDSFSYPYNYIGDCYRILGNFDTAEEFYNECKNKKDKNNKFYIYGLGKLYYEKGKIGNTEINYAKAIKCFKEIIHRAPRFPYAFLDLARVYARQRKFTEARANYDKAEKIFETRIAKKYWVDIIREYRDVINKIENIKNNAPKSSFDKVMSRSVMTIDQEQFVNKKSFLTFFKVKCNEDEAAADQENSMVLEVLRRWNSYTPMVASSKGGGYFFKIFNKGIVFDPGFNFVDNFIDAGHLFNEIDYVFVSHHHDDHTANLESIINLLYRFNKTLVDETIPLIIAKSENYAKSTVVKKLEAFEKLKDQGMVEKLTAEDREIVSKFNERYNELKKEIDFFVAETVIKKYLGLFELEDKIVVLDEGKHCLKKCQPADQSACEKCKKDARAVIKTFNYADSLGDAMNKSVEIIENGKVKVFPLKADHYKNKKGLKALGFGVIYTDERTAKPTLLVYTGDTAWTEEMKNQYEGLQNEYGGKADIILLAHLGGFDDKELNYRNKAGESGTEEIKIPYDSYYGTHLGRLGLTKLVETLKPGICIISEFGEEFKGLRVKITQIFSEAFNGKVLFFPADIGFKIDLLNQKVRAITKVDLKNKSLEYAYVKPDEVLAGEIPTMDCLYYYQKTDKFTERDCVEALTCRFAEKIKK